MSKQLPPKPSLEQLKTQRRILRQAAQCAAAGDIDWPNGTGSRELQREEPEAFESHLEPVPFLGRELDQLTPDELIEMWMGLAAQARRDGILVLQGYESRIADPLIREAVQLAVDGVGPRLIRDMLETRSRHAILPQQKTRGLMVIEGLLAIMAGDNPRIIHHKMNTLYVVRFGDRGWNGWGSAREVTAGDLVERLRQTPFSRMEFDLVAELIADLGFLARRERISGLAPLVEAVGDPLLKRGLELMLDQADRDPVLKALECQLGEGLRQIESLHQMVIAGVEAVQSGKDPDAVAESMEQAAA